MDMSPAYIKGARESFPDAEITFDRFHVVKLLNDAVEKVRRTEQKERPELKRSRWLWLWNPERLSPAPSGTMVRSRQAKRPCPDGHRRRDDPRARGRNPPLATFPHQQRHAGSHELARPGGEGSGPRLPHHRELHHHSLPAKSPFFDACRGICGGWDVHSIPTSAVGRSRPRPAEADRHRRSAGRGTTPSRPATCGIHVPHSFAAFRCTSTPTSNSHLRIGNGLRRTALKSGLRKGGANAVPNGCRFWAIPRPAGYPKTLRSPRKRPLRRAPLSESNLLHPSHAVATSHNKEERLF